MFRKLISPRAIIALKLVIGLGVAASMLQAAPAPSAPLADDRNRYIAALIAFLLGTLGVHRFYLGRIGSGIAMLVLTCTVIGLFVTVPWALIDMIRYLVMSDREFAARYARTTG